MRHLVANHQTVPIVSVGPSAPKPRKHGSPRAGLSLAAASEFRGKPVRESVRVLLDGFQEEQFGKAFKERFLPSSQTAPSSLPQKLLSARAAWSLISIWLLAQKNDGGLSRCSMQDAETWFRSDTQTPEQLFLELVSSESLWKAEQMLGSILLDAEFNDLLPYILEEHGPGSRASVIKDPTTAAARAAKRERGVFYTPADVADYMVGYVSKLYSGKLLSAKVLDPACGTGVFLLAMLRTAARQHGEGFSRFDYIRTCLHGFDVSRHALDSAAFLLLNECLAEVIARGISPRSAWHAIRRNLVETDALFVDSIGRGDTCSLLRLFPSSLTPLRDLFPEASDGFDILIGNPPYAVLAERMDYDLLATRFDSLRGVKASPRVNLFPLFVEMMWQFTNPGCNAAALVTPLSVAFHNGLQHVNCRRAMGEKGGRWQFAFFDREPHALFGEEVKTRNAILFRSESAETPQRGQAAIIETGPLRKWTSRTRHSLFQGLTFTSLGSVAIMAGIPKLGGIPQAEAFMALRGRRDSFQTLALRIGTCTLAEALTDGSLPKVIIGGTAYNFLNVYRPMKLPPVQSNYPLSENSVHCVEFKTEADASAAFAILSSRLVFWMWHVLGDGFHVASWLFKTIPFSRDTFSTAEYDSLSELGDALWGKLQSHRFISLNRGRQTIGFRPLACHEERDGVDAILAKAAGLDGQFAVELRRFVQDNAIVDPTDERRGHVATYFTERLV